MATLTEVRNALKTVLETIDGLTVYAQPPGHVVPPAAVITPGDGQFLVYITSNTSHDLELDVTLFVQRVQERSATEELDAYLADSGDYSIYATIAANRTLGGVVDSAIVTAASGYGVATYGDTEMKYLSVTFSIEVLL